MLLRFSILNQPSDAFLSGAKHRKANSRSFIKQEDYMFCISKALAFH